MEIYFLFLIQKFLPNFQKLSEEEQIKGSRI